MNARLRVDQAKPLVGFFALAYAWSWTVWWVLPRIIRGHGIAQFDVLDVTFIVVGACGPTIAALVTQWHLKHDLRISSVRFDGRAALGLLAGLVILLIATVIAPALVLIKASALSLHWKALLLWSTYGVNYSTLIGGPLNEEFGWRGFALPKLEKMAGSFRASVLLGLLWAGWHTPLFFVPGWISLSFWQFCIILIGVSAVLTLAANLANFSVIVAIVLHAFFNVSSRALAALTSGLPTRTHENAIYSIIAACVATAVAAAGFRLLRNGREGSELSKMKAQVN